MPTPKPTATRAIPAAAAGGHHGGWGVVAGMGRGPGGGGYPQQSSHPDGKKVLERISRETGGRFFEVSKKQPIDQIYTQIEQELRNQYSLGYTPDKAVAGPGYHKITLTTTNKDLTRADARRILRRAVERGAAPKKWCRLRCCWLGAMTSSPSQPVVA